MSYEQECIIAHLEQHRKTILNDEIDFPIIDIINKEKYQQIIKNYKKSQLLINFLFKVLYLNIKRAFNETISADLQQSVNRQKKLADYPLARLWW